MTIGKLQWSILTILGGLVIFCVTAWVGCSLHRQRIRDSIQDNLDRLNDQVSDYEMQERFEALHRLSESKAVTDYIQSGEYAETPDLLNYLNAYKVSLGASMIYIMDHTGDVIGCTPYGDNQTLTGNNYSIRPYFQKALAGDDYLYGALGLTTNERGFYFSTSGRDLENSETYVLVAKFPLDDMDRLLKASPMPLVLVTPSGVVFSAHDDSLLFRPVYSLPQETLDGVRRSKQFPGQSLEPLPFSLEGDAFDHDDTNYLVMRRDIAANGWLLISWAEYSVPWLTIVNYTLFFLVGYGIACFSLYFYRKKLEVQRTLYLSQQDYQAIFNASADAIFIHDPDTGKVIDVNTRTCEMYGCERSDILDGPPENFSANEVPYTPADAMKYIKQAADGKDQLFEWHARKLSGECFWVEVHLKRTELSGKPRLIAVVRDISERMQATLRLRKLSKAIEASPASVMITDREGTVEYVNDAFFKITGYSPEEILGKNSRILKSGVHPESFYQELWTTILRGNVWSGEICNMTKDKHMFWELARIAPIYNVGGEISHFVAVKGDITELKIAEKMLRASKQEAEQAARTKATFLANMSHEIRTPLNAVLGFISLSADRDDIPEDIRKNLNLAQRAAQELMKLLNDILDTSKLESGKMLLEVMPFNLQQLTEEIRSLFEERAEEKGLSLSVELQNSLQTLRKGDPAKIRQVVYNLVGNAIKFTQDGCIKFSVEPGEGEDEVLFKVSDTGIGIPPDLQSHIFSPFVQADESTTRRFGGSGLGTTISRQLVELMGGRIWLSSDEGSGTTFSFALPLPVADEPDSAVNPPSTTDEPSGADGADGGLNVLMAEDVEINQRLSKLWFDSTEHTLTVASDGQEAVNLYEKGTFDLILMDIHMPVMDGFMATAEIRKREKESGGHIPIIALTASVMKEECDEYLAAGMDDVIGKPIDFEALFKTINCIKPQFNG